MIKGGKRGYEQLVSIPEPEEKAAGGRGEGPGRDVRSAILCRALKQNLFPFTGFRFSLCPR